MTEPRTRELIVAIDGPSGAGKSTLSRLLAQRLGYLHVDTGAMYRAVALAALRRGIDPGQEEAVAALSRSLEIRFSREKGGDQRVLLEGEDVSEAIRLPEVSLATSRVASIPPVREAMVDQQQRLGAGGGVVLEGRDIGTVVFPGAEIKFFLTASSAERGRRRYEELRAKGQDVDLEQTIAEVESRDLADSRREHAPLRRAGDARLVDTTGRTIPEILGDLVEDVEERRLALGLVPRRGERP